MDWLPEPEPGTGVVLSFDGSDVNDWTAIRAETIDGYLFTPRWGDGGSYWDPVECGGRIPRTEVDACVDELFERFSVQRMYCDPPLWRTEIEQWSARHGDAVVLEWATYRAVPMFDAIERFLADLQAGRIRHDGCPATARHIANARVSPRRDGRYVLSKPDKDRHIDLAVASVLAHEAAADARADGWAETTDSTMLCW